MHVWLAQRWRARKPGRNALLLTTFVSYRAVAELAYAAVLAYEEQQLLLVEANSAANVVL